MKRIGILYGRERSFPPALIERINARAGGAVVAEPVRVGAGALNTPRKYDLIHDRISQDVPFYRAILKKFALDGTIVVNNPFWWSADDKFFNNVLAQRLGVAVPKTVILPSKERPPDTTAESFTNLEFPLRWDEIFSYVGFPAYFKPYAGGGWKNVYRVTSPAEFFAAYDQTGAHVMTLQEEIVYQEYYRCYVIGKRYVHLMRYDPKADFFHRYVRNPPPIEPQLEARIRGDCQKLAHALGYDFDTMEWAVRDGVPYAIDYLNPAPDADKFSVGEANFEWVLEHAATWLIERVQQGPDPLARLQWQELLSL